MTKKGLTVLFSILLGLTVLDIIVVEGYFHPARMIHEIWKYHIILISLAVALPLIAVKLTNSLLPLGALILFGFGLEDTLYYLFQGKLPEIYYGVYVTGIWEPTLQTVLSLNMVGLVMLTVFVLAVVRWYKNV